jgi:pyruvate/2-oxoglutarate/acetoin dehydrogenase E1 component
MIPLSEAEVIREGNDITLVGWGAQLTVMEQACLDAEKVYSFIFQLNDEWFAVILTKVLS